MLQEGPTLPAGCRLLSLEEVDSTNAEAMRHAAAGEAGPLWVWAESQRAGRGRSGRTWTSVPGNLYASLLIPLECSSDASHHLSLLAGVAVFDAIRAAAAEQARGLEGLRLKWPNDVLIGRAKLAGTLPECTSLPRRIAVIGIGINLAGHPSNLAGETTHLAAHGPQVSPAVALGHVAAAMANWLKRWSNGRGFPAVRGAWLERAGPPGEPITVNTGRERISGRFIGIDPEGALLLREEGGAERSFTFGDVSLAPAGQTGKGTA